MGALASHTGVEAGPDAVGSRNCGGQKVRQADGPRGGTRSEAMSYGVLARKHETAPAAKAKAPAKAASSGLRIGEAIDAFEREADRVADEVMTGGGPRRDWSLSRMSIAAPLQRKCSCGGECDDCKDKMLQREARVGDAPALAPQTVHDVLRGAGRQMDHGTRSYMESRFGHDFGGV